MASPWSDPPPQRPKLLEGQLKREEENDFEPSGTYDLMGLPDIGVCCVPRCDRRIEMIVYAHCNS